MNFSTAYSPRVEEDSPKPYSTKILLKTFTVRENYLALGPKANGSDEAATIGRAIYDTLDADKEHFVVLAFNQKHRLIGYKHTSTGTLTSSFFSVHAKPGPREGRR